MGERYETDRKGELILRGGCGIEKKERVAWERDVGEGKEWSTRRRAPSEGEMWREREKER